MHKIFLVFFFSRAHLCVHFYGSTRTVLNSIHMDNSVLRSILGLQQTAQKVYFLPWSQILGWESLLGHTVKCVLVYWKTDFCSLAVKYCSRKVCFQTKIRFQCQESWKLISVRMSNFIPFEEQPYTYNRRICYNTVEGGKYIKGLSLDKHTVSALQNYSQVGLISLPESSMGAERCFIINLLSVGEVPYFAIQVLFSIEQAQRTRGFYYYTTKLYNKTIQQKSQRKYQICCPLF